MVKIKGKKKKTKTNDSSSDKVTKNKSRIKNDNPDDTTLTLLQEIINHNIFFDNLVDQLGLGIQSRQEEDSDEDDDDESIDDDVYEMEDTSNSKKFKKGQNEENRETKRARLKQKNNLDSVTTDSAPNTSKDTEGTSKSKEDSNDNNIELKESSTITEVAVTKEGDNDESTSNIALSAQELRDKFQKKLESVKNYNPKKSSNQSADDKRNKRNEEKKKKKEKEQKKKNIENNKKSNTITTQKDKDKKLNETKKIPTAADDLATIDYGKIDGLAPKSYYHEDNKSLAYAEGGKKHLIHKLRDAEKKKEQIQKLQSSTDVTQKDKAKEILWDDTLKVASGEMRNNNDPIKLKKKIKQKLKKKEQSAKAWKERLERQENAKMERQKIRTHNLQQRKKGGSIGANLSKKRIAKDDADDDDDGKE